MFSKYAWVVPVKDKKGTSIVNAFLRHMLLVYWMVKKLLEVFMKKNCKKTNQKKFIIEKILKRKGDKLYIKWKGYDNFKSWINKKDLIQKWVNNFLSRLEVLEEI